MSIISSLFMRRFFQKNIPHQFSGIITENIIYSCNVHQNNKNIDWKISYWNNGWINVKSDEQSNIDQSVIDKIQLHIFLEEWIEKNNKTNENQRDKSVDYGHFIEILKNNSYYNKIGYICEKIKNGENIENNHMYSEIYNQKNKDILDKQIIEIFNDFYLEIRMKKM